MAVSNELKMKKDDGRGRWRRWSDPGQSTARQEKCSSCGRIGHSWEACQFRGVANQHLAPGRRHPEPGRHLAVTATGSERVSQRATQRIEFPNFSKALGQVSLPLSVRKGSGNIAGDTAAGGTPTQPSNSAAHQTSPCFASHPFQVGGYSWVLLVYPQGDAEDTKDYVSVFLALGSEGRDVQAFYEFRLISTHPPDAMSRATKGDENQMPSGSGKLLKAGSVRTKDVVRGRSRDLGPCRFEQHGWFVGFRRFVRRSALVPGGFLKDDTLSIWCTVEVLKEPTRQVTPPDEKPQSLVTFQSLRRLWAPCIGAPNETDKVKPVLP